MSGEFITGPDYVGIRSLRNRDEADFSEGRVVDLDVTSLVGARYEEPDE